MGFLKKVFQAATSTTQPEIRTIVFDQDWQDTMEMLRAEFAGKKSQTSVQIDVPDALCEDITTAIESHAPSARVPYSDSKVPINNVGESFRQEDLRELCGNAAGEDMPWLSGFLMPEILNPYDKYAVGIHAIMISNSLEPAAKKFTVAAIDLGIKGATPRALSIRGVETHVMPYNVSFKEISDLNPDGVFLSNGPGDPATMTATIDLVREILLAEIPIFGICFGHQILGRALGFETYKLQFGHRGINQPVIDKNTNKVEITAHNHGFALKAPTDGIFSTVFGTGEVTHVCLNDGVVEGLQLLERAAFSVQYHPEAAAGPHDADYLFDRFIDLMLKYPVAQRIK